jgi:hypothetical protein
MTDFLFEPPPPESLLRRILRFLSKHVVASITLLASLCTIAGFVVMWLKK